MQITSCLAENSLFNSQGMELFALLLIILASASDLNSFTPDVRNLDTLVI